MITMPWTTAMPTRPSASPATMLDTRVGVDSMRRDTPMRRVSISAVAVVIDVTKMNSRSRLLAPRSNRPRSAGKTAVPVVVVRTLTSATESAVRSVRARFVGRSAPRRCSSTRATFTRDACASTAARTTMPTCWAERSAREMYSIDTVSPSARARS